MNVLRADSEDYECSAFADLSQQGHLDEESSSPRESVFESSSRRGSFLAGGGGGSFLAELPVRKTPPLKLPKPPKVTNTGACIMCQHARALVCVFFGMRAGLYHTKSTVLTYHAHVRARAHANLQKDATILNSAAIWPASWDSLARAERRGTSACTSAHDLIPRNTKH